jgi:hypothetical protein
MKEDSYGTTPQSICNPDGSWINGGVNTSYDSVEFTLATRISDYDVALQQTYCFDNIELARYCEIRTDQTITVVLNDLANGAITVASSDSPYVIQDLEITDIFITNSSGSTANIKIRLS